MDEKITQVVSKLVNNITKVALEKAAVVLLKANMTLEKVKKDVQNVTIKIKKWENGKCVYSLTSLLILKFNPFA